MTSIAPLIGIIGKKRVGKDTFAAVLTEHFGYKRIALADPLRDALYRQNPIVGTFPLLDEGVTRVREWRVQDVVDSLGWEKAKDYVPEIRTQLQRLGTEGIRTIDDEFWIKAAFAKIDALREDGIPVVVTDVRYPNEGDAIRNANGYLIRITRNLPQDGDTHASEKAMDDYRENLSIPNNESREDLEYLASSLARDLQLIYAAMH
jgi:hypothetical protein